MVLLDVVETTSPTLTSGKFSITFDGLERVDHAILNIDASVNATLDSSVMFDWTIAYSTNVASVTVYKGLLAAQPSHEVAVTGDLSTRKITALGLQV